MFSPEDTICGFVAGISGRSVNDVSRCTDLTKDLNFRERDFVLLCTMISAEYEVFIPYTDALLWYWRTVDDVITSVECQTFSPEERRSGCDMLPEVVS